MLKRVIPPKRPKGKFGTGTGTAGQIKKKPYEDKIMKIASDKRKEEMKKKLSDLFNKAKQNKSNGRISVDDIKNVSKMKKGGRVK